MALNRTVWPRRTCLQGSLAVVGLSLLSGCGLSSSRGLWPAKIPRLALLATLDNQVRNVPAFYQGLQSLGYIDGQTIAVEARFAEQNAQFGALAAELVGLDPDLILAAISGAAEAAKRRTTTIPIVMASSANAVEIGLVASLARPGGNVTGMTIDQIGVVSKQLELIKETVTGLVRLAILWNPSNPANAASLRANEGVARTLGLELLPFEVRSPDDLPAAFAGVTETRAQALVAIAGVQSPQLDPAIVEFSRQQRLPAMFPRPEAVALGGLMSNTSDLNGGFERAATYVDKILKGARPADLPVERIDKFHLVVNLQAARELGVTIPPAVMAQVSELIQ
jgi:putative ABC transport system substrate-binding protein